MKGTSVKSQNMSHSFLILEISHQTFAIPVSRIREILPMVALLPTPGLPPFVAGWLEIDAIDEESGGSEMRALPVVRLDALLQLATDTRVPGLHTPILIVRSDSDAAASAGRTAIGLLVERVREIVSVGADAVQPARETATFNGCVEGLLFLSEKDVAIPILSRDRLLMSEEWERLAAFARIAEERRVALAMESAER